MKFREKFMQFVDFLGMVSFIVILITAMAQIINRYFFNSSFMWADELCIQLMIWITFLGAAKGVSVNAHTRLTVVVNLFPPIVRCCASILTNLLCIAFLGVSARYGFDLVQRSWSSTTVGTRISWGLVYLSMPLCSIIMIFLLIMIIVETIRDYNPNEGRPELIEVDPEEGSLL